MLFHVIWDFVDNSETGQKRSFNCSRNGNPAQGSFRPSTVSQMAAVASL